MFGGGRFHTANVRARLPDLWWVIFSIEICALPALSRPAVTPSRCGPIRLRHWTLRVITASRPDVGSTMRNLIARIGLGSTSSLFQVLWSSEMSLSNHARMAHPYLTRLGSFLSSDGSARR